MIPPLEIVADIVVKSEGEQHQVWLKLPSSPREIGNLVVRTPPTHTGIDDFDMTGQYLVEFLFKQMRKGLLKFHLKRLHERIPQQQYAIGSLTSLKIALDIPKAKGICVNMRLELM